jgi:hypothetical protein
MTRIQRIAAAAACVLLLAFPASAQLIGSGHVMGNGTSAPRTPTDVPLLQVLQQSGSGISLAGNTSVLSTVNGVIPNGHCRSTDSNHNAIDAGGPCTIGGGGGTVSSGLAQQIAIYPSSGNTVVGTFTPNFPATGNWYQNNGANLTRLNDQVLVGGATAWGGQSGIFTAPLDWLSTYQQTLTLAPPGSGGIGAGTGTFAELYVTTQDSSASASGAAAIVAGTRTKHYTAAGTSGLGVSSFVINNNATLATTVWGFYSEAHCVGLSTQSCIGMEVDPRTTVGNSLVPTPFQQGVVVGHQVGCGAGYTSGQNCDVGIQIVNNPNPFKVGINFISGSINNGPNGETAIALAAAMQIQWFFGSTVEAALGAVRTVPGT